MQSKDKSYIKNNIFSFLYLFFRNLYSLVVSSLHDTFKPINFIFYLFPYSNSQLSPKLVELETAAHVWIALSGNI